MNGSGDPPAELRPFQSSFLSRLATWTLVGTEDEGEAVAKATLTLGTTVIVAVSSVWVVTYLVIGRPLSAAIPFSYQVLSLGILWGLRQGRVGLATARWVESAVMLALPFLLHASLGGFVGSGGVAAWALCTPLLAYLYGSSPGRWMVGFGVLATIAAFLESRLADAVAPMPSGLRSAFFAINLVGVGVVIHFGISYAIAERERRRAELAEASVRIEAERNRADELLKSIMPSDVARRLKDGERRIADRVPEATVLAADIAGFTALADRTPPAELVEIVDEVWTRFDRMVEERGLEKIKSVGDSYIVVGGLDPSQGDQIEAIMELALAMAQPQPVEGREPIMMRVGMAHGPIVVGVIGEVRPAFGLWGDTVNTASRMESTGVPGRVQVTEPVWERLGHRFESEQRGEVDVKGKGPMRTFFVVDPRTDSIEPIPT